MPALMATDFHGEVVWLGRVADRDAALAAEPLEAVELDWGGIEGEAHGGVTRASCSRVLDQHPRGTEIANVRQLSVLSHEELEAIAAEMGLAAPWSGVAWGFAGAAWAAGFHSSAAVVAVAGRPMARPL